MELAELNSFLETYPGGVSVEEGLALSRYAENCCNGVIVEIGSFKGKSAVSLAAGQARGRFANGGYVSCIEPHLPFVGLYRGQFGPENRGDFYTVMLRIGFFDRVCLVGLKSEVASGGWKQPIGLLFVDGEHSIEGVRSDMSAWEHRVVPGGTMIFDDALDSRAGPHVVIEQLVRAGRYERV